MLERFRLMLRLEEKEGLKKKLVKHIAITTEGIEFWAKKNNKTLEQSYKKSFVIIRDIISLIIRSNIPLITFYISPKEIKRDESFNIFVDELVSFLNNMKGSELLHKNKAKVSALGKWYDMPGKAVEAVKSIIDETKDYDCFFLNFCINYEGQEEIADACRLIARQIKADKIDVDSITKETIKENIYSSYFLPPDLIINNGLQRNNSGLLLWDSIYSEMHFTGKPFPDFTKQDFLNIIKKYYTSK